ncbi:MAG: DUF1573 domain-containing protein [Bacteroidales bacterium]|jgi:hypothetical protein|nr:DUF1573 domain-containing protein [Bacteroidales bacterium]
MKNILYKMCAMTFITLMSITLLLAQTTPQMSIEFNKTIHDFGYIDMNSGPRSCSFIFKNISNQPVVIQTVISSCGCTTPEWTKSPVKPGEKGKIDVTFLNDQGPYPFDKSLTVYVTGSSRPIVLRVKGIVTQKPKTLRQQYPVKIGQLGLKRNPVELGQIQYGTISKGAVEVVNLAGNPIKISFTDFSKGFYINAVPDLVPENGKTDLIFSIDTKAANNWGTTIFSASPVINGKKADRPIQIKATILENFADMSKAELDKAPLPIFRRSSFSFGEVNEGSTVKCSFDFRNTGKSDLIIRQIQYSEDGIIAKYKDKIPASGSSKIEIEINTKNMSGEKNFVVTLVTNSPTRPIINLIISGKVTNKNS